MIATSTLLLLINSVRAKPFIYDYKIENIAETRCIEMKEWSHKGFPYHKITKLKYNYIGENLALGFGSEQDIFDALQNSPQHKKNNEDKRFLKVGIANCDNQLGNTTIILFGGK